MGRTLERIGQLPRERAREIEGAGKGIARARDLTLGAGVGAVTGVRGALPLDGKTPVPRSGHDFDNSSQCFVPWGFCWNDGSWCFGFSWWWDCWSPCYPWSWSFYFGSWYPYWYACYQPYVYSYPVYYSTVYYRDVYEEYPEAVYVDESVPAYEPVGEAAAPAGRGAAQDSHRLVSDRYLTLGDRAFREGRYTDAVQFYAKAVEFAPGEGALHLVLADALFAAGDYHYAAFSIRKALELEPELADAVVDKHAFYHDPAEFDRQLSVLEVYLRDHGTDGDARLVLALNYLLGGRALEAVSLLRSPAALALSSDPSAASILAAAERRVAEGAAAPR